MLLLTHTKRKVKPDKALCIKSQLRQVIKEVIEFKFGQAENQSSI